MKLLRQFLVPQTPPVKRLHRLDKTHELLIQVHELAGQGRKVQAKDGFQNRQLRKPVAECGIKPARQVRQAEEHVGGKQGPLHLHAIYGLIEYADHGTVATISPGPCSRATNSSVRTGVNTARLRKL